MSLSAELTVAWLTWRQLFARRRVWLAVAIAVLPFLLTFIYRLSSEDREGDRLAYMLNMNSGILLGGLLPLTAVIFGTTAFGGEVDDGTLLYLLVRPIPRWRVVLIKYLVAVLVSVVIIFASVLLAWLALRNSDLPWSFAKSFLIATGLGAAMYCAVFTYMGLVTRRGLIFGLLYIVFFENVLSRNMEGVKSLSVREFAQSIAQWASDGSVLWDGFVVPMSTVWTAGAIILVVALALAMRRLSRYEMAERL